MTEQPTKYHPDKYFVEERDLGNGYHYQVKPWMWWSFYLITFPLRYLPLFKPYKMVYSTGRILVFRSDKEVSYLNNESRK